MRDKTPKVSIVTVTYNCVDIVEKTICNVLKQTYPNIEYIVIDGNSTDGTREIVERYADRLACLISEPDKGIFDAMNKGILAATGEWILFMNAGDFFFKPTSIADVFDWYQDRGEVMIAGGTRNFINEGYVDIMFRKSDMDIWERPVPRHQATFIRLSVHKENLFPLNLKIAGDYYFFMKMMLCRAPFVVYNGIIALFENENGVSTREDNFVKLWNERLMVMRMLRAPECKIRQMKRRKRMMMLRRKLLDILKICPYLYRLYHRRVYIRQPLEVTLKDV